MKIRKLIIPAAGWGTRFLPNSKITHKELLPILNYPTIHYLLEEANESGIEEIIIVISPRKSNLLSFLGKNYELERELQEKGKIEELEQVLSTNWEDRLKIKVVFQIEQLGLGHAIALAGKYIKNEPFAIILGDDLIYSQKPAIKQLIEIFEKEQTSVIGVQKVPKEDLHKYGVIIPLKQLEDKNTFEIAGAIEKPKKDAPSDMAILGRYVFTPKIIQILKGIQYEDSEINLVDAFPRMMQKERILAHIFQGERFDLGSIEGFVKANIFYALKNETIHDSISKYLQNMINKNTK